MSRLLRSLPLVIPGLSLAPRVFAQATKTLEGLKTAGEKSGLATSTNTSSTQVVAAIVNGILGLTGLLFIILIVAGGVQYLTAQGDADKLKSAKGGLTWAVLGLVVVVAAYTIVTFLFSTLSGALGS